MQWSGRFLVLVYKQCMKQITTFTASYLSSENLREEVTLLSDEAPLLLLLLAAASVGVLVIITFIAMFAVAIYWLV